MLLQDEIHVAAQIGGNGSAIDGISNILFLDNMQSLVLQGVQRQVDGYRFVCRAGSGLILTTQDKPYAILSVLCEYLDIFSFSIYKTQQFSL